MSTPVNPNVCDAGVARFRRTTVALTVPPPGIAGAGKYCASDCAAPSMVKPVTIEGTPAASCRLSAVDQLKPCASGADGHTVSGAVGMMADAPVGSVTWMVLVTPPPLKAVSPEYCATNV